MFHEIEKGGQSTAFAVKSLTLEPAIILKQCRSKSTIKPYLLDVLKLYWKAPSGYAGSA